ncbi:MAG: DsbA family protein [Pseudomonadota bacterium]
MILNWLHSRYYNFWIKQRTLLCYAIALACLGVCVVTPDKALAAITLPVKPLLAKEIPDVIIGQTNAPLTIIEYTSLTCDHCAFFHKEILPKLKAKYIDTGQVRFVIRHYPLDRDALKAAALVSCLPEAKRYNAMTQLFSTQDQWINQDPENSLSKAIGMNIKQYQKCLTDEKIQDNVLLQRLNGEKTFSLEATPTFIVGKHVVEGVPPLDEFENLIAKVQNP